MSSLKYEDITYENWLKHNNWDNSEDAVRHFDIDPEDFYHLIDKSEIKDAYEEELEDREENPEKYEDAEEIEDLEFRYEEAGMAEAIKDLESRFDDFRYKYSTLSNPMTLFRAICLDSIDQLDRDNLGLPWTDNLDSAQCYDKHQRYGSDTSGGTYFTLKAEVPLNSIDWNHTINLNMNPAFGEDEQEISINTNQKVKVVDIQDQNDNWVGISFEGNSGKEYGSWKQNSKSSLIAALKKVTAAKRTLYHGTNKKRLDSIKKNGLQPTAPKASSGDDYVYLTDSPHIAAQFSGYGKDSQGQMREGYMAPLSAKKSSGVILKIEIDDKDLEADQIWAEKLEEMKSPESTYESIYESIKDDFESGNQVLDFYVEQELHKIWKESEPEEDDEYDPEYMEDELWEAAISNVIGRMAKKEADAIAKESKKFTQGELYQYPHPIEPSDIKDIIPAKKYLSDSEDGDRHFGNELAISDPFGA